MSDFVSLALGGICAGLLYLLLTILLLLVEKKSRYDAMLLEYNEEWKDYFERAP